MPERRWRKEKMAQRATNACDCGGLDEIVQDLVDEDLLELQPGERLWKLYCFREGAHPTALRHRIYTKRKADGRLALLTFAVHNPSQEEADAQSPRVRSALARVPDLSPTDLDRLIGAMRLQVQSDACEEVDLSSHRELDEQLARLRDERS